LQPVFLHEVGHALGIFGHSDSDKDVMQPQELALFGGKRTGKTIKVRFGGITARDVNTLKRIYELPALPQTFSLMQPLEWSMIGNSGRPADRGGQ
jgi:predicted Zn-dependent protease